MDSSRTLLGMWLVSVVVQSVANSFACQQSRPTKKLLVHMLLCFVIIHTQTSAGTSADNGSYTALYGTAGRGLASGGASLRRGSPCWTAKTHSSHGANPAQRKQLLLLLLQPPQPVRKTVSPPPRRPQAKLPCKPMGEHPGDSQQPASSAPAALSGRAACMGWGGLWDWLVTR